MPTDWPMVIGLAGLICTIVLGALAIAISLAFYFQGRNTEQRVSSSLAEIKQQTDSLQRLSGRMLDRLTRAVTETRPAQEQQQFMFIVEAMKTITTTSLSQQAPATISPEMRDWVRLLEADACFHIAIANVCLQQYLPASITDLPPQLQRLLDLSASDFSVLDGLLKPIAGELTGNGKTLYEEAVSFWKPHVRDTVGAFQAKGAAAESSGANTSTE